MFNSPYLIYKDKKDSIILGFIIYLVKLYTKHMKEVNKFSNLNLRTITVIQLIIAAIISLIFQFLLPFSWQPLDTFLYGPKQHGTPGANVIIFTMSQWYFSLSIAWLFYRNNPFLNNFLIYSIMPLGMIVIYEFFYAFPVLRLYSYNSCDC